jgi:hypothetical protein
MPVSLSCLNLQLWPGLSSVPTFPLMCTPPCSILLDAFCFLCTPLTSYVSLSQSMVFPGSPTAVDNLHLWLLAQTPRICVQHLWLLAQTHGLCVQLKWPPCLQTCCLLSLWTRAPQTLHMSKCWGPTCALFPTCVLEPSFSSTWT